MTKIYNICKLAMECIVSDDYEPLQKEEALTRVSEQDIKRVLAEYKPNEMPIMPPDDYFEKSADIYQYTDGSGYHVDIDFWYGAEQSDLTLQLDIRKKQDQLRFIIDDMHVL